MSKILILTASFGEGHNAAARALAAAIDREAGPGTAVTEDIFALAAPRYNELVRRSYLSLINRAPKLWIRFYRWSDRSSLVANTPALFFRELRVLRQILAREKPDAVCCTFPVATLLLEHLARTGGPRLPRYNIVTDSISIHSLWCRGACDGWFVPNEDSAAVVLRAGLNPALVHVSGRRRRERGRLPHRERREGQKHTEPPRDPPAHDARYFTVPRTSAPCFGRRQGRSRPRRTAARGWRRGVLPAPGG